MGTVLELTLVGSDPQTTRAVLAECLDQAEELDRVFSDYRSDSPLSLLNRAAGQGLLPVDPRLARILTDAKDYGAATTGAFDVSVGPLVDLWIAAARSDRVPEAAALAAARAEVGSQRIRIEGGRAALDAGMRIDLGAIAKGWALDRLRERLAEAGVRDALLDFGQSSLFALGHPLDAPDWTVALRGGRGEIVGLVHLRDRAFSVSGSLGQWSEIGGRRFGHVIDPRSGWALAEVVQAAVVAPSAAEAEAWSTALTVLGVGGLPEVEARRGIEALLLDEVGALRTTSGWHEAVAFQAMQ
jgi:thiamine biosynthesis lipoprotein